jgi:RNA polymerase sigma factor (sigma-70 family)
MMHDWQLLREYRRDGSQAAFSRLVERHLRPVYATCLREVHDPHLAEDVTQAVFLVLARKGPSLRAGVPLSGWLFNVARYAARNALRQEARRAARERKAAEMQATASEADSWREIDPVLNDALATLKSGDREIILLRFFHELSFGETGEALGISEDAAKMRVGRAVEKLRRYMAKVGVAVPAAWLAGLLAENAAQAMPAIGAASIAAGSAAVVAGGAGSVAIMEGAIKAMWMAKVKLAATVVGICLVGGGMLGWAAYSHGGGGAVAASASTAIVAPNVPEPDWDWRKKGDPEAVRLLDQMVAAYDGLSSYSSTAEFSGIQGASPLPTVGSRASIAFQRPSKLAIKPLDEADKGSALGSQSIRQAVNDGKNVRCEGPPGSNEIYKYQNEYLNEDKLHAVFGGAHGSWGWLSWLIGERDPFTLLWQEQLAARVGNTDLKSLKVLEPSRADGVATDRVLATTTANFDGKRYETCQIFSIGHKDHLLRLVTSTSKDLVSNVVSSSEERYVHVAANPSLPDSVFVFHPHPGDKELERIWRDPRHVPHSMARPGNAVFTGRVTFEDGKPAAGIKVVAEMKDNVLDELCDEQNARVPDRLWRMHRAEAVSGEDGSYSLSGLTDLPYDVAASDEAGRRGAVVVGVTGKEGGTVTVPDLVLTAGGFVSGTVVDKRTEKP